MSREVGSASPLIMPSPSDLRLSQKPTVGGEDTQRRYGRDRAAMPRIAVVCPAQELHDADTARRVRQQRITVAVSSSSELALAVSMGIKSTQLVMYGDGSQWGPIRCALNASVRQFVVNSFEQIPVLAHFAKRGQQVLVDQGSADAEASIGAICALGRLELVGLHCRLDPRSAAPHCYAGAIHAMVARMARVRQESGVITTRVSLAGPLGAEAGAVAAAIEDAMDASCGRWSFPRPGLALTPQ